MGILTQREAAVTVSSWDKQEIVKQFETCKNLGDVIAQLESDFSVKGEVICEIRVNGMVLAEEDETQFAESGFEEIKELAVRSNKPDELISQALQSAFDFVPQVERHCVETAERMRSPEMAESNQSFQVTLEACQWLIDTLVHIRGAASGIGAPIEKAESWFSAVQATMKTVTEVSNAFEKGDQVLVADLLEYEMTGALNIWKGALAHEMIRRA
jgi:hypothetical protein